MRATKTHDQTEFCFNEQAERQAILRAVETHEQTQYRLSEQAERQATLRAAPFAENFEREPQNSHRREISQMLNVNLSVVKRLKKTIALCLIMRHFITTP